MDFLRRAGDEFVIRITVAINHTGYRIRCTKRAHHAALQKKYCCLEQCRALPVQRKKKFEVHASLVIDILGVKSTPAVPGKKQLNSGHAIAYSHESYLYGVQLGRRGKLSTYRDKRLCEEK